MSRVDAVQVKIGLTGEAARRAVAQLGLHDDGVGRSVWFCERPAVPENPVSLYALGVILRFRHSDRGDGTSTVKLRPCRRAQLRPRWLVMTEEDGQRLRIEEDWSGDRLLTASLE